MKTSELVREAKEQVRRHMAVQVESKAGVGIKRHSVTLEEYDRMVDASVFDPQARIELIRGEMVDMPPPGPEHESSVARLHILLGEKLHRRALMWPQGNSIGLPESNSRPQPDITLLKWRDDFYAGQRPRSEDVILLVEVSDSSLKLDRGAKLQLYAEAGIPEYWVANLVDGVIEIYSDPDTGAAKYRKARLAKRGETIQLQAGTPGGTPEAPGPGIEVAVDEILGPAKKA
jgi:Uma2 family endonuclease